MIDDAASTGCEQFVEGTREISPANLLMKIESFSLLSEYGIGKYESKAFESGGYTWNVMVCFDGDDVSAYLSSVETESLPQGWEVNAVFTFFIYNHHLDTYLCFRGTTRRFNAVISKYGFSKVISKKDLIDPSKGYIVEDNCIFGAEVFVFTKPISQCVSLIKDAAPFIKDAALFKRDWKIPDFSKLQRCWNSENFEVGEHTWRVSLYRNGVEDDGYLSIFVRCVDPEDCVPDHKWKAQITLRIKSQHSDAHRSEKLHFWFTSSSRVLHGHGRFMSVDDLRSGGFLLDDCCFLDVEISVKARALNAPEL